MDAFSTLADPLRRDLLVRLAAGPARVVDLASEQPVSRPAISRHLRLLGEAGLVDVREVGRERHYCLRPAPLEQVRSFVTALQTRRPPVPETALDALTTEVRRTTRERRTNRTAEATHHEEIA